MSIVRPGAFISTCLQMYPVIFVSVWRSLLHAFLGRPLFVLPCGFHVRACLVIVDAGFRSVWPIHPHRLLLITSPAVSWCFSPTSQCCWCCRFLLRQLLMKVCTFSVVMLIFLHICALHSSTDFTLDLNRRICVCNDKTLELKMLRSCINVHLAFPTLA